VQAPQRAGDGAPEPWRAEVNAVHDSLAADAPPDPVPALERVVRTLEAAGQRRAALVFARPVLTRARVFGRHLVSLDLREFSGHLEAAVAEMLRLGGVEADYAALPEDERVALLERELGSRRALLPPFEARSERVALVLEPLEAARDARVAHGERAFGRYIMSHAESASDVLEVLVLAREAGLREVDVSPLFETIEDLEAAPRVMHRLLSSPAYRAHLGDRVQEVMIGYSDSNKEAGYVAANWALYTAQEELTRVLAGFGVPHRFFHGRGTSIGRGGGPAARGILAQPGGTIGRGLRLTEQGEALADRYANAPLAKRNLEQLLHALLLKAAEEAEPWPEEFRAAMGVAARASRESYERLTQDAGFVEFFEAATPINEIASLKVASRPVRRPGAASLENLRAIPWVMSWSQTRANVPGWFGLGRALEAIERDHPGLAPRMYAEWPFFRTLLDNAQMSLAKSDMGLFMRYASLARDASLARQIKQEFDRTVRLVTRVTGGPLLGSEPVLQRSIQLRNPYVDPIHHVQVELLRRYRSRPADHPDRPGLERALMLSIQGIAAGLRNTG
jgi:phosphoenolpyruvate carboxylase